MNLRTWDTYASDNSITFFTSRAEWQREVARRFPTAHITREPKGNVRFVYRAFLRRHKVGVFGNLRGFGYVTGTFVAELLHGKGVKHHG